MGRERLYSTHSPAFRDLFQIIRELSRQKDYTNCDDDSLRWHEEHPLWNLSTLPTSTGINQVASGTYHEGGYPSLHISLDGLDSRAVIVMGHLDLTQIIDGSIEMSSPSCFNVLTTEGHVLQSGDPFYDSSWDGNHSVDLGHRILEERQIRKLKAHVEGW